MSGAVGYDRILVLGGARSGKSRYAQALAEASGLDLVFVATAQAFDAEMADRIARHAGARGSRWRLVEAPLLLPEAIATQARPGRVLLIDCATLWLTNVMLGSDDVEAASRALAGACEQAKGPLIVVSNEIGSGLVPDTPMGRAFRDAQGRLNQMLGEACAAVALVVAGLPLQLKPQTRPPLAIAVAGESHRELTGAASGAA